MGVLIGETGGYSTWAKLRSPIVRGYDQYDLFVGPGAFPHNYVIDSGFYPDGGQFLRSDGWPVSSFWLDSSSNPHTEQDGPILGFMNGFGTSPSYFSVGAYDWSGNDTTNPVYTSVNNLLDEDDIADGLVGQTVTYSGGAFTATSDAFENNAPYTPWFGQNIGLNAITSVTAISNFTAF